METWNERSEHGFLHAGATRQAPAAQEVLDRITVGIRAALALRWEPRSVREFVEDLDFGEERG